MQRGIQKPQGLRNLLRGTFRTTYVQLIMLLVAS